MADIRCPMCSKTNSSAAELCRFCGARLVPLAPGFQQPTPGKEDPAGAAEDWLGTLRSGASALDQAGESSYEEAVDSRQSEEFPDWLSRIQPAPPADEDALPAPTNESIAQDLNAWLRSLEQETPADEPPTEPAPAETSASLPASPADSLPESLYSPPGEAPVSENIPDWLADLSSLAAKPAAADQPEPPASSPAAAGELDWLSELSSGVTFEPAAQAPQEAAGAEPEAETPALASELSSISPAEPASAAWLAAIEREEPVPSEPGLTAAEDFPDWLSEFGRKADQQDEIPAWGAEQSTESEALPADNLPDWLNAMPRPAGEALPEIPATNELAWLSEFASAEQSAPAESASPLPEMEPLAALDITPAEEITASSVPALELPEAAPAAAELDGVQEIPALFAAPTPREPELPDWLAEFKNIGAPAEELSRAESIEEQPSAAAEELTAAAEPAAYLPEWLSKVKTEAADQASLSSVPPLLSGESTPLPQELSLESVTQMGGDLPNWLTHPEPAEKDADEPSAELAPAELPGWVEAMRPVEVGAAGSLPTAEADLRVEKSGPLAGLQGVLPIQGVPAAAARTKAYGSELHLTDRQRQSLNLLQEVIAEETRPFAVLTRRGDAPRMLFRLLVGLMLILAFVLWSVSGFEFTPPPAAAPQIQNLYQGLDRLAPGAPVLLVVEYEGGLSGEMRLVSLTLMRHLMEKNVRLVSLSTLPVGPALAGDLVQQAQKGTQYALAEQFTNLGYLAGGSTSLVELATSPLPRAFPTTLDGKPFQAQNALQGIHQLRDFAAVLILTDSPDAARAWIEQVQTPLRQSAGGMRQPFYVISSAQAAPLILPYLDSGQVQGLVAGLAGSAAYEAAAQRHGPASLFWGAYQLGILFSILILLAGGLMQAAASLSRRPGKRG